MAAQRDVFEKVLVAIAQKFPMMAQAEAEMFLDAKGWNEQGETVDFNVIVGHIVTPKSVTIDGTGLNFMCDVEDGVDTITIRVAPSDIVDVFPVWAEALRGVIEQADYDGTSCEVHAFNDDLTRKIGSRRLMIERYQRVISGVSEHVSEADVKKQQDSIEAHYAKIDDLGAYA